MRIMLALDVNEEDLYGATPDEVEAGLRARLSAFIVEPEGIVSEVRSRVVAVLRPDLTEVAVAALGVGSEGLEDNDLAESYGVDSDGLDVLWKFQRDVEQTAPAFEVG